MTIMNETSHVQMFKFNTYLKMNTNNNKNNKSDIKMYPGVGLLPKALVVL